mmetsp:Transcript_16144/g.23748  ORF Transcript_16144/g.23748 Transcript_16144/m.23748 type:complete len:301 (-) Transcript_16144:42-944(-)
MSLQNDLLTVETTTMESPATLNPPESISSEAEPRRKTVLITGANRGLGRALLELFAQHSDEWIVIATACNIDTIPKLPNVLALPLDLSIPVHHDHLIQLLLNHQHHQQELQQQVLTPGEVLNPSSTAIKINVVIHNAGFHPKDRDSGYLESTMYIKEFSSSSVMNCCMINAVGPMELTGKLLRHELLASQDENLTVLALSSWLGSISTKTFAGHYGYAGSKALMNMFIKGLALEFSKIAPHWTAVALNPGWMSTDMGGENADFTPHQVAIAIYDIVQDQTFIQSQNGKFLNTMDRTEHPW